MKDFAMRCLLSVLTVAMLFGGPCAGAESAAPAAKDVFFFIPHTHWEGAVFETREGYLKIGLPHISQALKLLKDHPNYRFTLDQACYVKPFLERRPQETAAFRQFVKESRLAIVGGMDVMPDVNMPGGESFVRQVLYGKGYFRKSLGVDVTVGWLLDTFGHHGQMPQLLKLGGYKSFWFFRGVADWNTPSEFLWEGIDGSRIPAFWLPYGYAVTYGSPSDLPAFTKFFKSQFDSLAPFARGRGRVGPAGADVAPPEPHVPALVEQFNRQPDAPFQLRLAVPGDFEALVAQRPNPPVVRGELNPIFQGTYSSRIELKQRTRALEKLLTTAEKLGVLLRVAGMPVEDEDLWDAWEPMLFNQTHDLMSGVMSERVYQDTVRGFGVSQRIADEAVQIRLRSLSAAIDTQGEGIPVVVFNTLGWLRTDVAIAKVDFPAANTADVRVVGPDGAEIPVQLLSSQHGAAGGPTRAEIAFVARDVPAMGHAVYRVSTRAGWAAPTAPGVADPKEPVIENEHYRLEFDAASGAITRLLVKADRWEALRGPGNVVAREPDRGDLWELYRTLDGGSRIAMKTQHPPPQPGKALFSTEQAGPRGTVSRGPVFSEFKVAHPFGKKGSFATTVRLYTGLRRIEIRTRIVNDEPFVRYRALFPTSIGDGQSTHEIPFGASRRPAGIEFPAQNWIDYGNGRRGVALLNQGLPGNNVADGTMMLSLLRSTRIVTYGGEGGGYAAGADSSLELGNERTFDYALVPHAGDWRQAAIYRYGLEFNQPLVACTVASHPGTRPKRRGFLEISPQNVVVSALKSGPEGTAVLRVYEAAGQPATATIRVSATVAAAEEVNLMEDPGRKLTVADNTMHLELRPFEIKTIKLRLPSSNAANR
jgi:alpha-mannosidase